MVVAGLEPRFRFLDRAGLATSTRNVALRLWNGRLPERNPAALVRELYAEENRDVSRLDYDWRHEGGIFPAHIEQDTDPTWIRRLGASGRECYEAIAGRDLKGLGASFNQSMACWEALLPCTVRHRALTVDLPAILRYYQSRYPGAIYSGCGGGYLIVASAEPVPGTFRVRLRLR